MNKLTTSLFLLLIALSLLGCPPAKNNILLKSGRQSTTLEYLDSDYFEKQLSTAMSQKPPKIEVTVLSPFSTNDIPDRLDAWLTMIGETGGQVKAAPIDSRKNMVVSLLLTLHSVYQKLKKQFKYDSARHYNAQLLYRRNKSGDALIEKIIFRHRKLKPEKPTPAMLGDKHALLIGIENYPNVSPLRGAINDVKLIQGVLRQRFGFRDDNFLILLNEQATHTGVEKAFRTLIEQVKPNDFVYIHYAGHGAQTADLNGDERKGQDETWVSFGSRQPGNEKDNYDILDDEIHTWLAAIYAKTDRVIFISDSCHSATVARDKVPISRCLKRDNRSHPQGRMAYTKLKKYHGIHISATRDKELAAETLGDDGKYYGLFTWHWAKALQQAQVGETWDDVFKRAVTKIVSWHGEAQRPQIQGGRYRREHLMLQCQYDKDCAGRGYRSRTEGNHKGLPLRSRPAQK
ncbi:MAG: caspase family protein [Pseudomonadota bacterium]